MDSIIHIVIDKSVFWDYKKYYQVQNPKARTFPFATKEGYDAVNSKGNKCRKYRSKNIKDITIDDMDVKILSLNQLMSISSRQSLKLATLKKQWGLFGEWLADKYNMSDKHYAKASISYELYSRTQANNDCDNAFAGVKFLNDGLLVKSGAFVDDNYKHINPISMKLGYDKENPRLELKINIIE